MTHDGTNLIMSDGTHIIRFINPETFETVRTITVLDEKNKPLMEINELEYIKGEIWANIWQKGDIVIEIPDDVEVIFDRGHLSQIAWNLVRNAWQHCKKEPASIVITARPGYMGDAVICELNDDGPGIPADARTSLFEPFFTTRPGGTGLGLYIARELADANGAALELLPKGPGAHFRLTLKRALAQTAKA